MLAERRILQVRPSYAYLMLILCVSYASLQQHLMLIAAMLERLVTSISIRITITITN